MKKRRIQIEGVKYESAPAQKIGLCYGCIGYETLDAGELCGKMYNKIPCDEIIFIKSKTKEEAK